MTRPAGQVVAFPGYPRPMLRLNTGAAHTPITPLEGMQALTNVTPLGAAVVQRVSDIMPVGLRLQQWAIDSLCQRALRLELEVAALQADALAKNRRGQAASAAAKRLRSAQLLRGVERLKLRKPGLSDEGAVRALFVEHRGAWAWDALSPDQQRVILANARRRLVRARKTCDVGP